MARYRIAYLDGEDENVTANTIEITGSQYVVYRDGKPAGFVPVANVRSVHRQDDEADSQ
ncbi:hypothetical protein TUSST3_09370 [Streptomyces sp. TUS-ST3]|jgi:hypothetical protein|uniref:hypothetical protein n=1 Tax=Streptomyces sp. TUS-ST3 TaxID=3025591 RepID=UPI0024E16B85|nr:hypothetical protein [Streptomyces sp. TUS-ST3]GLP64317.1 hypothetical protein TUSST3_09370 [Streptomyces sp. TUS-ST3]